MAIKTYTGSCHCGAVRFEADLDLEAGTSKCDCRFCLKTRNWSVITKPERLRVRAGEDALADYPPTESPIRHPFCRRCGVRAFSRGHLEELGGDYVSIRVACLDDASPEELLAGPVQYCDGRNDNWWNPPAEVRHL